MADEDIWSDNWNQDEYGGVDSQEDYLTFGATDYYQRAFSPEDRGSTYTALSPAQEGPREGKTLGKTLGSYSKEASAETPSNNPQSGGYGTFTTVPSQYLRGDKEQVKENVDVLTEGRGVTLTQPQGIFQNAVTRVASGITSLKDRAWDVFNRSRGG
jgi:hypothetical protein